MLKEYFSLEISDEGRLLSIPLLLKGYMPSLTKLPRFLLRLGPFVDWTDEQKCFESFLRELSSFYVPEKLPPKSKISPSTNDSEVSTPASSDAENGEEDSTNRPNNRKHVSSDGWRSLYLINAERDESQDDKYQQIRQIL